MTHIVFSQKAFSLLQGCLTLKHSVFITAVRLCSSVTLAVVGLCQHSGADKTHKVTRVTFYLPPLDLSQT